MTGRSSEQSTRTLFSLQFHGNCSILSGNEMHIKSPQRILDSALLTCIHMHRTYYKEKNQHKSTSSLNP